MEKMTLHARILRSLNDPDGYPMQQDETLFLIALVLRDGEAVTQGNPAIGLRSLSVEAVGLEPAMRGMLEVDRG